MWAVVGGGSCGEDHLGTTTAEAQAPVCLLRPQRTRNKPFILSIDFIAHSLDAFIPGSGRSPGGGNGNPLQYSCLGNSMDRGAWRATVHGVARVGHDLVTKPLPLDA
ncbi:unnamed protein product [Rangifer tarandus platyrhynchus]|uniref:Uncharacterized protein n=1 Tax=Rangifer tarandus platyrhynchus TaxID=3082113 RepID=A0ABN8YJS0_RANTA|nr:unnamed protein product [Rangifer tarandus platyrhynchus]